MGFVGTTAILDWVNLQKLVPKHYDDLINYCIRLWEEIASIERVGHDMITSRNLRQLYVLGVGMLSEYNKFIFSGSTSDDEKKRIDMDIKGSLRIFFDERTGNFRDWSIYFERRTSEEIAHYIQFIIAPLITFAETRIYNSLMKAYERVMSQQTFDPFFLMETKQKAGIYPKPPEKPSLEELEPKEEKEEKPKKKKKEE